MSRYDQMRIDEERPPPLPASRTPCRAPMASAAAAMVAAVKASPGAKKGYERTAITDGDAEYIDADLD